MASVSLNERIRSDLSREVGKIMDRHLINVANEQQDLLRQWGYSTRTQFTEKLLAAIHGEEHWAAIQQVASFPQDIAKAFGMDMDPTTARMGFQYINEAAHEASTTIQLHMDMTYPGLYDPPSYYAASRNRFVSGNLFVTLENPMWEQVAKLHHINWAIDRQKWRYRHYVDRFLANRNTAGQVRRDWPGLLDLFPSHITQKLGDTVAKRTKDYVPPTEEDLRMQAEIEEALAMAVMLPNFTDVNREQHEKKLVISGL
jgi:hypothetical protein